MLVLFPFGSGALPLEDAKLFVNSVERGDFCSSDFKKLFRGDLKEVSLLLYLDNCSNLPEVWNVKNPYGRLKLASLLKASGDKGKAEKIYRGLFSSSNNFDEEILLENRGSWSFLFQPKILRLKVWRAAKNREIDTALFYLSYLRDDPYYTYLLAYTFLKGGKRKKAKELFLSSLPDERYFFLIFLSRELPEKFLYYKKLMGSSAKISFKRFATIYVLDRLFEKDLGLFRRALPLSKIFPSIYRYYLARYYAFTGNCRELKRLSKKLETAGVLYSVCSRGKWERKGVDFYTLLLSPPEKFPFKKEEVFSGLKLEDSGLSYLYSKGYCSAISFIDTPSPQNALAQYLCGNYKKGIKLAAPFKKGLKKYLYLLPVLYPKPAVFGNDIFSLAIARQESLFDGRALSRSGAIGLMQIMPFTGKYIAKKLRVKNFKIHHLYRPEVNYKFGSFYIHSLIKRFRLFPLAAAAYNCGPTRIKKSLERFGKVKTPEDLIIFTDIYLPFQETRDYVKRTYVNLYYYSNLYGKGTEWKIFSHR